MSIKDSNKNAKAKYRKKVKELRVELYPTDEDIKERLAERVNAGEYKASYVKRLIREDIKKENIEYSTKKEYYRPKHKDGE